MARLPYLDETDAPPEGARALAEVRARRGAVSAVQRILAHSPAVLRAYECCAEALGAVTGVDVRTRELVILRSAHLLGNAYAWRRHEEPARAAGLTDDEIAALRGDEPTAATARDRALLRLIDDYLLRRASGDDAVEAVRAAFGDAGLVEILFVLGWYQLAATIMVPLDLAADDVTPGSPAE